jgi:energy-coupling factor transporter ATP-binding protein EcfA2
MSRIDTLQIHNFKFFNEQEPIKLDGKHLLLYGENGSGKSSIYWALYTLFEASIKNEPKDVKKYFRNQTKHPQSLINIHANSIPAEGLIPEHYNSFINVKTTHTPFLEYEVSLLNTDIVGDSVAKEINYASDFITYKVLYKFQDFWNGAPMDLADIFIGYILPYINFPTKDLIRDSQIVHFTNASEMYEQIKKGPGTTTSSGKDKNRVIQVYKTSPENIKFNAFVKHFNENLQDLIDFVNVNAPIILKELGYDIDFELRLTNLYHNKKDVIFEFLNFKIEFIITSYLGKKITINRPQSFLNEAKITAIAVAIRLTILKKRINKQAGDILKFIVFDDVMISLDMNNRDKLIDYLLNPLNGYTEDYQILFLTHDKSFYDFVIHKINKWSSPTKWVFKEMYVGFNETNDIEEPVIIDGDLSFYAKAKKYYRTKDYTASAIYIRKGLEKIISERLPNELKYKTDGKFISLQKMWEHLVERYSSLGKPFTKDIQESFSQTKLLVLNPQAHFQQISSPLYRIELDKAFKLIDNIQKHYPIPSSTIILDKGSKIRFKHPHINYSVDFELETTFSTNSLKDLKEQIRLPKCKILHWQFKDVDFWNVEKNTVTQYDLKVKPLSLKLNDIILMNSTKVGMEISVDLFLENSKVDSSLWHLKELCDKSKIVFETSLPPNKISLTPILQ